MLIVNSVKEDFFEVLFSNIVFFNTTNNRSFRNRTANYRKHKNPLHVSNSALKLFSLIQDNEVSRHFRK